MPKYDAEIDTAFELIAEFGGVLTFLDLADNVPADPDQPWLGSGNAPIERLAIGVIIDASGGVDGTGKVAYIPARDIDYEITKSMQLVDFDGITWRIDDVNTLAPNGERILYTLKVSEWQLT